MTQDKDEKEMLAFLGFDSVERLFDDVPASVRADLTGLSEGLSEQEVKKRVETILNKNRSSDDGPSFLGGGVFDYYIPAAVTSIASRAEFVTSYTPYQPEVSQGLLQTLFEYQSMMSALTGMEVVNNSIYDHSTALGEAVLMAARSKKGGVFLVPEAMAKSRWSVLRNYCVGAGIELRPYSYDKASGTADLGDLESKVSEDIIGAYVESPNIFGVLETDLERIRGLLESQILVIGANALALAVTKPPGEYDADIAITEGQILGNCVNYGGPLLGVFCCKKTFVRKMPGRVVGLTHDSDGRRAFCMTLQTREQHIRREKATSNICSNEALTAIATAAYLALLGGGGLRTMAVSVMEKRKRLQDMLGQIEGCQSPVFDAPHFNEFVVRLPIGAVTAVEKLAKNGILAGVPLNRLIDGDGNCLVISVTDKTSEEDIDVLASAMKEVCQ